VEVTPAEILAQERQELRRERGRTWRRSAAVLEKEGSADKGRRVRPRMKFIVILVLTQIVSGLGKSFIDF
jgi:hypothetical protein